MDEQRVLAVLEDAAEAVAQALDNVQDWSAPGQRPGQHGFDLVADEAACSVLVGAGMAVFSEESGRSGDGGSPLVVLDPVDGSTNAAHGLPWFSTSLCAIDECGPWVAAVVNHPGGVHYQATRHGGATRDGEPIQPSSCRRMSEAVVALSGLPAGHPGWAQFRALGASSLELCLVADGTLDAFGVTPSAAIYPWDYLGGWLVCHEAGAFVTEARGADLMVVEDCRRQPVAAGTPELLKAVAAVMATEG